MNARAEGDEPPIIPSERVRAEVATWPPLTEHQLNSLAVLLRPAALELRRRRTATAATRPARASVARPSRGQAT